MIGQSTVVTISITLMMAILMPVFQRIRMQAKGVICQSNLHQSGLMFSMYTSDNGGYFSKPGVHSTFWISALRPYHQEPNLFLCPMAMKPTFPEGAWRPAGGKFQAWGRFKRSERDEMKEGDYGSYGINAWVYNPPPQMKKFLIHPTINNWRTPSVEGAGNIPLFMDSAWPEGYPEPFDQPPEYDGHCGVTVGKYSMPRFCINRHDGYINSLFMDWSVGKVGLKELWMLKWHRQYNTAGPWTKAGGVQPKDWPQWIRSFN